jgi:hypothetical protein
MFLCLLSGVAGLYLHYDARVEFKLELNPSLAGWDLFWRTVKGPTMPPVLAPGAMIQIALLGLAYSYRHPLLTKTTTTKTTESITKVP